MDEFPAPSSQSRYPRGVYRIPYRDEYGYELIVAIDRRGRRIASPMRVFPREDRTAVVAMLRRMLDEADPDPIQAPDQVRSPPARPPAAARAHECETASPPPPVR